MAYKSAIEKTKLPNMLLSHVELYVQDINQMEQFYTKYWGLVVSDRGDGANEMVFLSRSPKEHLHIVLNPTPSHQSCASPIDHTSFRVKSLTELRIFNSNLQLWPNIKIQMVSHGSTWSIYFRNPENNRFDIFTDTPW